MEQKKHLARIEVIVDKDPDSKNPADRNCMVEVEGYRREVLHALTVVVNQVADKTGIPREILLMILSAAGKSEKASRKQTTDLSPLLHMMREGEQ